MRLLGHTQTEMQYRSVGLIARELDYSSRGYVSEVVRDILAATDDEWYSTPTIDAVRGTGNISLEAALYHDPQSINSRDSLGYTALH